VEVTVNRQVDPSKLAAAHVEPPETEAKPAPRDGDGAARNDDAEVAA